MLMSLIKQATKSPVKLGRVFLLCLVLYLATKSFIIDLALVLMAVGYVKRFLRQHAKDAAAKAEAEAKEQAVAAPPAQQAPAATKTAEPQPQHEYAKSAVVIPFKTGTRG